MLICWYHYSLRKDLGCEIPESQKLQMLSWFFTVDVSLSLSFNLFICKEVRGCLIRVASFYSKLHVVEIHLHLNSTMHCEDHIFRKQDTILRKLWALNFMIQIKILPCCVASINLLTHSKLSSSIFQKLKK